MSSDDYEDLAMFGFFRRDRRKEPPDEVWCLIRADGYATRVDNHRSNAVEMAHKDEAPVRYVRADRSPENRLDKLLRRVDQILASPSSIPTDVRNALAEACKEATKDRHPKSIPPSKI